MLSSIFEPGLPEEFNADAAVVRHELAHGAVWAHFGGGIGRLQFRRAGDGLLEAALHCGPRTADQSDTREFRDNVAARLLAGELAARRYLGMRTDRVSLDIAFLPQRARADQIRTLCRPKEDLQKVMDLTDGEEEWIAWFKERLSTASKLVQALWAVIDAGAISLLRRIPMKRDEKITISGTDVISSLFRHGLVASDPSVPVIELVRPEDKGSAGTRIRRAWRRLMGRRWRYV